jgi:hypothetical protein
LGGVALAALGVVLARVVAPGLAGTARPLAEIAGQLLALAGLIVIACGVSRRVHHGPAP